MHRTTSRYGDQAPHLITGLQVLAVVASLVACGTSVRPATSASRPSTPPAITLTLPTLVGPSAPPSARPTTARPARPPAAPATGWADRDDFGYAKAVVATTGGPCLSVDRVVELRGQAAAAWVARHPADASNNDLAVIADEDGPRLVCLPLASRPAIALSIDAQDGKGNRLHPGTLDQLRRLLADPLTYGSGAPTWFLAVTFYRWHYDATGRVDRVTSFWTP